MKPSGKRLLAGALGLAFIALLDRDRTLPARRRDIEGEGVRAAEMRLAEPTEQDPQVGVDVRCGAEG